MNTALSRLDRIENLFPDILRRWARPMQLIDEAELPADIRVDVTENDKEYLVTAEIPGAKKEDVRVSVDGSYVSISAEIKKDEEKKQGRSIVRETYHGSVSRGFSLASEVDDKNAVAKLEDGVLRLTLPKRANGTHNVLKIQ
ncbi:molecular chaperone (small heat shock protein) [Variovorax sp. CF313]|jgi:HSP20 family protein|uniref:Hsp20/alpha crystallin family protein n=1 Tax=Variovorax sp. CF313 TaxID=1144315 RepID=UPI0002710952|nr:Hsp20 family protein [Variovorax sp. CF313]EJL80413.1 molecular chaperone (small heat shock protein) [Variovorax sp. CF313]